MTAPSLEEKLRVYRPVVEAELRAVVGESPLPLMAWMRYHLGWEDAGGQPLPVRGGKLLRPAAVFLAAEAFGESARRVAPAAAAVELLHNFSLLHDDIEDRSERRRDRATLWTFAGLAQAINTGDGMHALARHALYRLLDLGIRDHAVLAAARELDEACLRLVEGQYRDLAMEGRTDVSRADYLAMSEGKTAAMFAAPFAIGALLAGAKPQAVEALREFGRHVGLAFQAADDILGIWGDPAVTGKPASDDLRSRKMTYPVIAALEDGGAELLARDYASPPSEDEDYTALAAHIERLGGRAAAESLAAEQEQAAARALEAAALDDPWPALFLEYARMAALREV